MLIECLIQRASDTELVIHGFRYKFQQVDDGALVCDVMSQEHQDWLLRMPNCYRIYTPRHKADVFVDEGLNVEEEIGEEEEETDPAPGQGLSPPVYNFDSEEDARVFISDLKINDLRKIAKKYGVPMSVNAKKEDIQEAVIKAVYHDKG